MSIALQRYLSEFGDSILNAFDLTAWSRCTTLGRVFLSLKVHSGAVGIRVCEVTRRGERELQVLSSETPRVAERSVEIRVQGNTGLLMPRVMSLSSAASFSLEFRTNDTPHRRDAHVAFATVISGQRQHIAGNVPVFRRFLASLNPAAKARATLVVVDNESANRVEEAPGVVVLRNPNLGCSGGFSRALYELCNGELEGIGASHVCLMDDDIYLHPEMPGRTLAFAQFLKPGFHLGAPMYPARGRSSVPKQAACVGHLYRGGMNPNDEAIGAGLEVGNADRAVRLNRRPDTSGWWWNCIALEDVRKVGLPYPFFIKMDDVEYSLRLRDRGVELVTPLSWWTLHDDFEDKYTAGSQYFRHRNRWILLAQRNQLPTRRHFALQVSEQVLRCVAMRQYECAELVCRAIGDFLKGPEVIASQGKRTLAAVSAVNQVERSRPLSLAEVHRVDLSDEVRPVRSEWMRRLTLGTLNWHGSPFGRHLLLNRAAADSCASRSGRRITFWNPETRTGFTVERSCRRALRVVGLLLAQLMSTWKYPRIGRAYSETRDVYTSSDFWRGRFASHRETSPGMKISRQAGPEKGTRG